MNGVRRFLTGNTATSDPPQPHPVIPIAPLSLNTKPSWPSTETDQTTNVLTDSPVSTTSPLSLKRDKQRPLDEDQSRRPSTRKDSSQLTSPSRVLPPNAARLAVDHRNGEDAYSTRDELLLSLLASEAVVECQGHEILSSEQVEELKKVRCSRQLSRLPASNTTLLGVSSPVIPLGRS